MSSTGYSNIYKNMVNVKEAYIPTPYSLICNTVKHYLLIEFNDYTCMKSPSFLFLSYIFFMVLKIVFSNYCQYRDRIE